MVIYKNTVFLKKITTNYRLKEIILQLLILDKYKPAEVYFHTIHSTLCGSVLSHFTKINKICRLLDYQSDSISSVMK